MSRYIETILLLNGELRNLEFHQERFERTRFEALGIRRHSLLHEEIRPPDGLEQGRFKCRVSYGKEIELIEFEAYREHLVRSLKLVHSDSIDYAYKYADRRELAKLFQLRGDCDDILVVKNNCLSDSFYANVIFWDGSQWLTPDTPLLAGTMRASLLRKEVIKECRITPGDLSGYQKFKLINAMNDLDYAPEISMDCIH